jgi:hypothetical protein
MLSLLVTLFLGCSWTPYFYRSTDFARFTVTVHYTFLYSLGFLMFDHTYNITTLRSLYTGIMGNTPTSTT